MIAFAAVALLAGCVQKEEVAVDPYATNFVYLKAPGLNTFNALFTAAGGYVQPFEEEQKLVVEVRSTKAAPQDVKVTIDSDESLVAAYNEANGTDYELLTGIDIQDLNITLKKGEYVSADTLRISHDLHEDLMEKGTKTYILPITITDFTGSLTKSEKATFYLFYNVTEVVGRVVKDYVGTEVDRSGWTVTHNGDDITRTATSSSGYRTIPTGDAIIVDMGAMYDLKSFGVEFDWSISYAAKSVSLYYSEDGENYTEAGEYFNEFTQLNLIVEFFDVVHCRYVKIVMGAPLSYSCDLNQLHATTAN